MPGPNKDLELGVRNVALMIASHLVYRPQEFVQPARQLQHAATIVLSEAECELNPHAFPRVEQLLFVLPRAEFPGRPIPASTSPS